MYITILILLSLMAVYWSLTLYKLVTSSDLPTEWNLDDATASDSDPVSSPPLKLSVLIPARNEEENIEKSVRSALALEWPGELEVIVVDDRSSDQTPDILKKLQLEDQRLKIIEGQEPPTGWLGKPHALHLAQAHATGTCLLFVDADVALTTRGPLKTWQRMVEHEADVSSVLGRLETGSFFEHIIQPRLGALLAGGNPLNAVNDPEDDRVLANGQFILFTRNAYAKVGGHEAIRDSVLDDVDIATRTQKLGLRYCLFYGQTVFSCRMYRGLGEIWSGWSKNLFPGMRYSLLGTLILALLLICWCCLPFAALVYLIATGTVTKSEPLHLLLMGNIVLMLATDALGHFVRGYKWHYFWTFPFAMLMISLLFLNSAFRITFGLGAQWKGRTVETRKQRIERLQRQDSEENS